MDFLIRLLFLIMAVTLFVVIISIIFSLFLIIWPFLVAGMLMAMGYRWYLRNKEKIQPTYKRNTAQEKIIIIEHEEARKE